MSTVSEVASRPLDGSAGLAERLTRRRVEIRLTQGQLAERVTFWNTHKQEWVALSRSAYCMYEAGDVVPDLHKVEQLAKVLDCSPAWLAFGKRAS